MRGRSGSSSRDAGPCTHLRPPAGAHASDVHPNCFRADCPCCRRSRSLRPPARSARNEVGPASRRSLGPPVPRSAPRPHLRILRRRLPRRSLHDWVTCQRRCVAFRFRPSKQRRAMPVTDCRRIFRLSRGVAAWRCRWKRHTTAPAANPRRLGRRAGSYNHSGDNCESHSSFTFTAASRSPAYNDSHRRSEHLRIPPPVGGKEFGTKCVAECDAAHDPATRRKLYRAHIASAIDGV